MAQNPNQEYAMQFSNPMSAFTGTKTRLGQITKPQRRAMNLFVSDASKLWYKAIPASQFESNVAPATRNSLAKANIVHKRRNRNSGGDEYILTGMGKTFHSALVYLGFRRDQRSVGR